MSFFVRKLTHFDNLLARGEAAVLIGLVSVMTLIVFLQVVYRYALKQPLYWSEEVARYLFVWVVFVGAGVAARYRGHIALDFLVNRFPPRPRHVVAMIMGVLSLAMLLLVFVWYGWTLTLVSMRQESPATGVPVGYATLAIPVGGLLTALNAVRAVREHRSAEVGP